jgi:hypothetical protein
MSTEGYDKVLVNEDKYVIGVRVGEKSDHGTIYNNKGEILVGFEAPMRISENYLDRLNPTIYTDDSEFKEWFGIESYAQEFVNGQFVHGAYLGKRGIVGIKYSDNMHSWYYEFELVGDLLDGDRRFCIVPAIEERMISEAEVGYHRKLGVCILYKDGLRWKGYRAYPPRKSVKYVPDDIKDEGISVLFDADKVGEIEVFELMKMKQYRKFKFERVK